MKSRSAWVYRAYIATIAVKGLDGAIEILAGIVIAIAGSVRLYEFAIWITAPEIAHNAHSHVAHAIRSGASGLAHASTTFVVAYLLIHGVLKLVIAISLLRETSWIFPVATVVLSGFIVFMGLRLTAHWSPWLLTFALFDVLTVALVVNEWRRFRAEHRHA